MFKNLLTLVVFIPYLMACATTNQFEVAEFDDDPQYALPALTVFMQHPGDEFRAACEQFDAESVLHHCSLNSLKLETLHAFLADSGVFEGVAYADRDTDFQLLVSSAIYHYESASNLGSAAIAGATMMLAPMVMSTTIKAEIGLHWRGALLESFSYELPFELRHSLLSLDQDADGDLAKSVGSHLVRDLQLGDYFTPSRIAQTLQATNYLEMLAPPQSLGAFEQDVFFVAYHPFVGAQVRYVEPHALLSYFDVFVYPVRAWRWDEHEDVLAAELQTVQRDIELAAEEAGSSELRFGELQWHDIPGYGAGAYLGAGYVDSIQTQINTNTLITVVGDKFVKLRHSYLASMPARDLAPLLEEFLLGVDVLGESVFMAKVRKTWRENGEEKPQ